MLDTSRVNAVTLYSLAKQIPLNKIDPYEIGMELGKSLVGPYLLRRDTTGLTSFVLQKRALVLRGLGLEEPVAGTSTPRHLKPATSEDRILEEMPKVC